MKQTHADRLLDEQRLLITRVFAGTATPREVERLAEIVTALDRWMMQGKRRPNAWGRHETN